MPGQPLYRQKGSNETGPTARMVHARADRPQETTGYYREKVAGETERKAGHDAKGAQNYGHIKSRDNQDAG